MELNEYKCPNCGQPIKYNIYRKSFYCEFCGSDYSAENLQEYNEVIQKHSAGEISDYDFTSQTWTEEDKKNLKVFSCNSCGGEIIVDKNTGSATCPYCGSFLVNSKDFEGEVKPDKIIPFKHTKDQAVQILKKYYKTKFLLPKTFKTENQIQKIEGIYVPFWLYNATVEGDFIYSGTTTLTYRKGDYRIYETSHYHLYRTGEVNFKDLPVDCSTKIPDEYSQSIEPYDMKELIPFSTAYLAGFLADKYDVASEECKNIANSRMRKTVKKASRETTAAYDDVDEIKSFIDIKHANISYVMLPVWVLNTRYQGKLYTFMMNGQTGKIVCNMPIDKRKLVLSCLAIFAVFFILVFVFVYLKLQALEV